MKEWALWSLKWVSIATVVAAIVVPITKLIGDLYFAFTDAKDRLTLTGILAALAVAFATQAWQFFVAERRIKLDRGLGAETIGWRILYPLKALHAEIDSNLQKARAADNAKSPIHPNELLVAVPKIFEGTNLKYEQLDRHDALHITHLLGAIDRHNYLLDQKVKPAGELTELLEGEPLYVFSRNLKACEFAAEQLISSLRERSKDVALRRLNDAN